MEYTFEAWIKCKEALNLNNKTIAEAIGTTEDNVRKQLGPEKKMPTWARAIIFAWNQRKFIGIEEIPIPSNDMEGLLAVVVKKRSTGEVTNVDLTKLAEEKGVTKSDMVKRVMFPPGGIVTGKLERLSKPCSCYLDDKGLLRRGKGSTCNLPKHKHVFVI